MNPEKLDSNDSAAGSITDEDIATQKELVGLEEPNRTREFHSTVSVDSIRNFALCIGDDNPLHTDPDYAAKTRWGSLVAPNIMTAIVNEPLRGERLPKEIKKKGRGLFKGCQIFMSGGTWNWYRRIYPGDTLYSFEGEESVEEKASEFGGRTVHIVRRYVKFNQRGEVVGIYRALRIIAERKAAREKKKYSEMEPAHYSSDEAKEIDARYLEEKPRGATMRLWEDVQEGDELTPIQKGPLTVTDVFLAHCAGYGFAPYRMLASGRVAAKDRQIMPGLYSRNDHGAFDTEARVHWDRELAKKVGNPDAYDWGLQREFWLHHLLTDWAGDDGFVVSQKDEIRKFNYMGDLQTLTGKVVSKIDDDDGRFVDVEIKATNQRGVETAIAQARISLPSKNGPAALPLVPADLAATAAEFFRLHNREEV